MQHHKARGLIVLILAAILLLGGCKEDVSFILPPESTGEQLQVGVIFQPETVSPTTDATTEPTAETTVPTVETTAPTQPTTAPTEETTVPTEETTAPTEATTAPTSPVETQPKDTSPKPTEHRHHYNKSVVSPTCTKSGYTLFSCGCGDSYKEDHKDALGHDYKVTTVPPTTSNRGYDLYKCVRCGDSHKDNYVDKLPGNTTPTPTEPAPTEHKHRYEKTVVDPTCTKEGYTKYSCDCGDSYTENRKKALGHDYKVTVVQPTVEERGYNLHECTRCGDSYKDTYVDKLPAHTDPPETEPPETNPPENSHPVYDISDHVVGSLEYEILAEINARRAEEGLSELKMDKKLCALAAIRAYEASISFSHTRPNGTSCFTVLKEYKYKGGSLAGENLLHCNPSYSASKLVDVWMKSTSHKNNIMTSSFTKAGLGIYYADGRMYVANFFVG